MLVWPLHGYRGWPAIGTQLLCPLSLMMNSLCVGSKAITHMPIGLTRGRTAFAVRMTVMALRVAEVVAPIGTGLDAVDASLTETHSVPRRATGPSARISAVALSSSVFNARRVSVLDMRRLAVTCWPLRCS